MLRKILLVLICVSALIVVLREIENKRYMSEFNSIVSDMPIMRQWEPCNDSQSHGADLIIPESYTRKDIIKLLLSLDEVTVGNYLFVRGFANRLSYTNLTNNIHDDTVSSGYLFFFYRDKHYNSYRLVWTQKVGRFSNLYGIEEYDFNQ